ncbi:MAG: DNA repair protein RecN [Gammaproteobacteria bacterium]
MLTRLAVRDLAVIREAELEPGAGFTVLTGETGAGKSLLVDALGLVLGDRGAASLVRDGAKHANVTAEFTPIADKGLRKILEARDLPDGDPLTLHRQMGADGRSRAWINGIPMPLAALREIGEALVEIHGQHEHLALAQPANQRALLDAYAKAETITAEVVAAAEAVRVADAALVSAHAAVAGRNERLEFLRFQQRELDELAPREGEYDGLNGEYEALRHRERSTETLATALAVLDDNDASALATLAAAREALAGLPAGAGFGEAVEWLSQAEALTGESVRQLRRLAETEADPDRVEWLNGRIARYQSLARKHACEPGELAARLQAIETEIAELDEGGERPARLERELADAKERYNGLAAKLSAKRAAAAPRFAASVEKAVRELGMPRARFEVALEAVDKDACPPGGRERVGFLVAGSAGQTPGPIGQFASGGELSRLALAIEALASGNAGMPVMVFDEVDAGVSGRVAELVGRQLKALAANRQVLCVTHLPQVAALADHHFTVSKTETGHASATNVEALDSERRVEAIAAMLAGVKIGESARRHARELIGG